MDFGSIGTVSSYVNSLSQQNKVEEKASGGSVAKTQYTTKTDKSDISADAAESYTDDEKKTVQEWMDEQDKTLDALVNGDSEANAKDSRLSGILSKHYNGGKLTSSELEYLRKKSPSSYRMAKAAQEERSRAEKAYKQCKTKDEVHRMRMNNTCAEYSAVKGGSGNSSSDGVIRVSSAERGFGDYMKSGEYSSLPSDAEVKKAEHDVKKAKNAAEAEKSPEVKKVKRARAKAKAYKAATSSDSVIAAFVSKA